MIPETINDQSLLELEQYHSPSSKTYRLDFKNKRIIGKVDEAEAVLQFIRKVFNTDKDACEIYDWYYGNELFTLIGKPRAYAITECPRIIEEALLVDDRILSVDSFQFEEVSTDSLLLSCVVRTIFGALNYTQEVLI